MCLLPRDCSRHAVTGIASLLAAVAAKTTEETTLAAPSGWWGRERVPGFKFEVET